MISSVQPTIQRRNDDIQVDTIANEYQAAKCTCDHSFETLRIRGGTADPDVINENGSTSRSTRKRQVSIAHESGMMDERVRTRRKPTSTDNEMLWICEECREAECTEDPDAVLMICDGSCKRAFHNHCCGINANAAESEDLWVCSDCMNKKHRCALCQEYGTDDEDVFLCDKKGCGMFFHESCLRMQNIDVRLVAIDNASAEQKEITPTNDDESDAKTRPVFICPAHSCWTCTEDYIPEDGEENGKGKSTKNRGKRRKQANSKGNFLSKKDGLLFRCLECPTAYHASCIPPSCRFHELALLCHDHSSSHKLPELDMATSMQCRVEAEIDKKYEKMLSTVTKGKKSRANDLNDDSVNPFFPGLRGDGITAEERKLLDELDAQMTSASEAYCVTLHFCLPCDFKEEVYAKPPHYKHIQSLRYHPSKKPKRKPATGESCECHKSGARICDDNCLNRMIMLECVGDKDKGNGEKNSYWNCDAGPNCGNRQIGQRTFSKCKPKREQGKGWGLVSINGIKKGELVQEYMGEVIDEATKEKRLVEWSKEHPSDPNFYIMQLESGWYIDARLEANLSRFINHSCDPNCHLAQMNVNGFARVGVFALFDIAPGEFLSYDYQFDTKDGDKFVCRCGTVNCRGTMKGGKQKALEDSRKSSKEIWKEAKTKFDRDVKFLEEVERVEAERYSQVDATVPGAEFPHELVASGPSQTRDAEGRVGLFLWRNAVIGADFASRSRRLPRKKSCKKEILPKVDVLRLMTSNIGTK